MKLDVLAYLTILIPLVLAIIGYFFNKRLEGKKNDRERRNRQLAEQLIRVNKQLDEFYGPLLAVVQANQKAWDSFTKKHDGNPHFYRKKHNPTPEQVAEFHTWMKTVFLPNNMTLHDIIVNKTSLMMEDEIPGVLLGLLAHIAEFKIIFARRKDEHEEVAETGNKYEGEALLKYCEEKFRALKIKQSELLEGTSPG